MQWEGLSYATHPDVYVPSHDTLLLARSVAAEVRSGERFLEVGCGAALCGLVAARIGADVTCTDLNPHAVALALHNASQNGLKLAAVETDLLEGLAGPFDVVAFNPPYLPTGPGEVVPGPLNLAFDGGTDGNQTVLRFCQQLGRLRPRPRCVLVIHSSLSESGPLAAAMAGLGYAENIALQESHFFERLTVRRYASPGTT